MRRSLISWTYVSSSTDLLSRWSTSLWYPDLLIIPCLSYTDIESSTGLLSYSFTALLVSFLTDLRSYSSFALLVSSWSTVAGTFIYISCFGNFPLMLITVQYVKVRATDCIFCNLCVDIIGSIGLRIYKGRSTKSVAGVHTGATPARRCSWIIPCYTMLHLFCLVLWDRLGVERRTRHVFKNHVRRRSTGIFGTNTNCPALNVLHSTSKFKHVCALFACRFLRPWVSLALKVFTGNAAKWQWRFGASWLQDHYYTCVRCTWIYSILGSSNKLFIIIILFTKFHVISCDWHSLYP